jgi:hypothetical protein
MKILYRIHKCSNEGESDKKHAPSKIGAFSRAEDTGYRGGGYEGYDTHCHRQNQVGCRNRVPVGCWKTVLR